MRIWLQWAHRIGWRLSTAPISPTSPWKAARPSNHLSAVASDASSRIFGLLQGGVQSLKSHPLPAALAVLALVLLKPRRAWRWLQGGLVLWRRWRLLRAWLPRSLLSRWLLERVIRRG